ncbi:Protein arginine N-methyltransferase 2 [Candida viswanathii]|uniref:Arginine N-methyltransferase 2 n=1 Tax=Candida viswanathii TaxID=5486 RepID=A0A367YJS1_9ASCO|nr:Protein arginine N-methyltransferase 2 [Candida viswanathii]
MSDLHDLCRFEARPIDKSYVEKLQHYLKSGIPSTYTVEEAYNYTNNIDIEPTTTTTPLHLICRNVPLDTTNEEKEVVNQMVEILFEYGAGWSFTDVENLTPGCILIKRGLKGSKLYDLIVDAGVRAELILRKASEFDMEIIEDTDDLNHEEFGEAVPELVEEKEEEEEKEAPQEPVVEVDDPVDAPTQNQQSYLNTKLEYTDDSLITKDRKDGVMMAWETDIMKLGSDTLFHGTIIDQTTQEEDSDIYILNIGFGMGIIDGFIQEQRPTKHYICEAHPDVLVKMKKDGWYEKENVVVLEGRWQDKLDELLSNGQVFFNGIYYDTFLEHYSDMLELFDYVVGLLKPHGVFSFFNGLGADREVIYEVYKKLVEIDLGNYGLDCKFSEIEIPKEMLQDSDDKSVWDNVKRSYWSCPVYYHPEIKFIDY